MANIFNTKLNKKNLYSYIKDDPSLLSVVSRSLILEGISKVQWLELLKKDFMSTMYYLPRQHSDLLSDIKVEPESYMGLLSLDLNIPHTILFEIFNSDIKLLYVYTYFFNAYEGNSSFINFVDHYPEFILQNLDDLPTKESVAEAICCLRLQHLKSIDNLWSKVNIFTFMDNYKQKKVLDFWEYIIEIAPANFKTEQIYARADYLEVFCL